MTNLTSIMNAVNDVKKAAPELAKLKKSTEQLEAVFMKKLLGEMQKGTQQVHFGDSTGNEMYQDMFNEAVSQDLSKQGALGIGKMLYKPMARQVMATLKQNAAQQAATTKEDIKA